MSVTAAESIIAARKAENPITVLADGIQHPAAEGKNPFEKTVLLANGLLKASQPMYGSKQFIG